MKAKIVGLFLCLVIFMQPRIAYADFFGGDLPLLAAIVANTLEQLTKLQSIIGSGKDTLALLQEINRGIREAMAIIRTQNSTLSPGVLSDLQNAAQLLSAIERLYGKIPNTSQAPVQATTDLTVAESIHLHNEAFRYADAVDPEAERIKDYAKEVSPLGAQRLSAQALGVLIHVMNQVLRTNAAILKIQSETLALQNRKEKMQSAQFRLKYDDLSKAVREIKPNYQLPTVAP